MDNKIKKLILASASPRRSFLLKELGLHFEVFPADVDEAVRTGETPSECAKRLAVQKATIVLKGKKPEKDRPLYSLGADTIVVMNGKIYGKPRHEEETIAFWRALGGRTHEVITAFAIAELPDRIVCEEAVSSRVTLKALSDGEIREYLATGEPFDKAGAYAAQGLGQKYVEKIEGSVTNVIGLPLEALLPWLKKLKLL
ncbi:MAG: septum formation protein Maf [Deltaproteobacteria bacterium]|nr:septum formation protein Maf [Deltaproteobacteria bacterium]